MRVEYVGPKKFRRKEELRYARENVQYTLIRLEKVNPSCIYRDDILAAKMRVEILEKTVR